MRHHLSSIKIIRDQSLAVIAAGKNQSECVVCSYLSKRKEESFYDAF